MVKLYPVTLSASERAALEQQLRGGILSFRQARRIRTLLLADAGDTDEEIAAEVDVHRSSVERTRKRFASGGVAAALGERPRSGRPPKLSGKQEALVVALACSRAPDGRTRWTLRQLTERVVGLEIVQEVSFGTIRRLLKKTR